MASPDVGSMDRQIIDTVVVSNVNPIEKIEYSSLLVATTINNQPAERLIREVRHFDPADTGVDDRMGRARLGVAEGVEVLEVRLVQRVPAQGDMGRYSEI